MEWSVLRRWPVLRLIGRGVNEDWNVPQALELLQGVQASGVLLLQKLDTHLQQRDTGGGKHPELIGSAVSATVLVSYGTEIAIKTLLAQTKPSKCPPHSHDLLRCFAELDEEVQAEVAAALMSMEPVGGADWIGENPDVRNILEVGRTNFVDWRYLPEEGTVGGGAPKSLINVMQAVRQVCLTHM